MSLCRSRKFGRSLAGLLLSVSAFAQHPEKPKWHWKQTGSRTIELNTLEGQGFSLPKAPRMKIIIEADSAVFSGILPKQKVAAYSQTKRTPGSMDFRGTPCAQINAVKGAVVCRTDNIPYPAVFYIQDKRGAGTLLGAAAGAVGLAHPLSGSGGQMVDRAAKPNRVAITIFVPECVENCPTSNSTPTR